ncbi:hypothetical protein CsatA_000742 [Cannabis sativa]
MRRNNTKSYEYYWLKAHNHNKVEKQFEIEKFTERMPFSRLSHKSETRAPTHALSGHHHQYKPILSIEKNIIMNDQFKTQNLTPSSLFQQGN